EKEQDADPCAAADAHGEPHVADEKRAERGHGPFHRSGCPNGSSFTPSHPIGPWAAASMSPPPARWAHLRFASLACAAASSAEVGASSSQFARSTAISRASERRRRCPAER